MRDTKRCSLRVDKDKADVIMGAWVTLVVVASTILLLSFLDYIIP